MDTGKPSISAQQVAWARAYLTWMGVLDDPWAETMLRSPWRQLAKVSRWPGLSRVGRNRTFAYLAARTLFYDQAVRDGLDHEASQVVIVGAGYDSRAWRLARPGVRFFEVDHLATQTDKQRRAPAGGPIYVAADLDADDVAEPLRAAGLSDAETTLYVAEGLIMYLSEFRVRRLFESLSRLGAEGSSLVTNFGIGFADDDRTSVRSLVRRGLIALRGEPFKFRLPAEQATGFLAETGWTVNAAMTGPEIAQRYLPSGRPPRGRPHPRHALVRGRCVGISRLIPLGAHTQSLWGPTPSCNRPSSDFRPLPNHDRRVPLGRAHHPQPSCRIRWPGAHTTPGLHGHVPVVVEPPRACCRRRALASPTGGLCSLRYE